MKSEVAVRASPVPENLVPEGMKKGDFSTKSPLDG